MAKIENRTTKLETRLARADRQRSERLVETSGRTRTELVREAILFWMDHKEGTELSERDMTSLRIALRPVMEALDRHHERQNSLFVRFGIDVGMLLALISNRLPATDRAKIMDSARLFAVNRFSKKLDSAAHELKERMGRKYPQSDARPE